MFSHTPVNIFFLEQKYKNTKESSKDEKMLLTFKMNQPNKFKNRK